MVQSRLPLLEKALTSTLGRSVQVVLKGAPNSFLATATPTEDHLREIAELKRRIRNLGFDIQDAFEDAKKRTLSDINEYKEYNPELKGDRPMINALNFEFNELFAAAESFIKFLDSWTVRGADVDIL